MTNGTIETRVLAGAPVRDAILAGLKARITNAGSPHIALATVLVGDDAPSRKYVASNAPRRRGNRTGRGGEFYEGLTAYHPIP